MTILHHLNEFDFVLIGIVLLSIIISFFRGFLREAISLTTWVLGVVVALRFAQPLSQVLVDSIKSMMLRYIVAFLVLFLFVFALGVLVNWLVHRLVQGTGVTWIDRCLGALFGAARGLLAVAVILLLSSMSPMQKTAWAQSSELATYFSPLVLWLDGFLPEQIQQLSEWAMGGTTRQTDTSAPAFRQHLPKKGV